MGGEVDPAAVSPFAAAAAQTSSSSNVTPGTPPPPAAGPKAAPGAVAPPAAAAVGTTASLAAADGSLKAAPGAGASSNSRQPSIAPAPSAALAATAAGGAADNIPPRKQRQRVSRTSSSNTSSGGAAGQPGAASMPAAPPPAAGNSATTAAAAPPAAPAAANSTPPAGTSAPVVPTPADSPAVAGESSKAGQTPALSTQPSTQSSVAAGSPPTAAAPAPPTDQGGAAQANHMRQRTGVSSSRNTAGNQHSSSSRRQSEDTAAAAAEPSAGGGDGDGTASAAAAPPPPPAAASRAPVPIPTGLKPIRTRGDAAGATQPADGPVVPPAPPAAAAPAAPSQQQQQAVEAPATPEADHHHQQQQQHQQGHPEHSGHYGTSGTSDTAATARTEEAQLMSPRYTRGIPCTRAHLAAAAAAGSDRGGFFGSSGAAAAGGTLGHLLGSATATAALTATATVLHGTMCSTARMLVVKVVKTGMLQPDVMLRAPVVRLHVVSAETGEYLCLPQQLAGSQTDGQTSGDTATGAAGSSGRTKASSKGSTRRDQEHSLVPPEAQSELLAYPGRPTLTTVTTADGTASSALLEYLPPVQTRPVDLTTSPTAPGLMGCWVEELAVDVPPEVLLLEDALLLLEVLQLPESFREWKKRSSHFIQESHSPGYRVAWAFYRCRGLSSPEFKSLEADLQLYRYAPEQSKLLHRSAKSRTAAAAAYQAWKALHVDRTSNSPDTTASGNSGWESPSPHPGDASSDAGSPSHLGGFQTGPSTAGSGSRLRSSSSSSSKYPSTLRVVLSQRQRPNELVVTDPSKGVRPALPAGYGSGFEIGRYPAALLTSGGPRGLFTEGAGSGSGAYASMAPLEQHTTRPHTTPCQVPNVTGVTLKGTSGGTSCLAWSHDGRWLAVAAAEAGGTTRVLIYHALAGELYATLGTHQGLVYSLRWSKDDCALLSASADLTARVWHMPSGPAAASAAATVNTGQTLTGQSLTETIFNSGGSTCTILQHTCYVYAAEFLPVYQQQPYLQRTIGNRRKAAVMDDLANGSPTTATTSSTVFSRGSPKWGTLAASGSCLVLTAGYDGALRLLDGHSGALLWAVLAHRKPITTLALDPLGTRLYSGDLSGCLQEYAVDLGQLHIALASPMHTSSSALKADDLPLMKTWRPNKRTAAADEAPASSTNTPTAAGDATGTTTTCSSTYQPPSPHRLQPPGSGAFEPLKKLRSSWEFKGRPISWLGLHPGGHHLVVQTRSSDLAALDCKLLLVARRFQPLRAGSSCVQPALSPDGQYVLAGSDNGVVTAWDFATATPTQLPHLALGGAPVHSMAWSYSFHAVATCSYSHYTPIKISCYSRSRPCCPLTPPAPDALKAAAAAAAAGQEEEESMKRALNARKYRGEVPSRITPELVHRMLQQIRDGAQERGVYHLADQSGKQLVVLAAHALRDPAHDQSSSPALRSSHAKVAPRTPLGRRQAGRLGSAAAAHEHGEGEAAGAHAMDGDSVLVL